jgi:prolipoprotein diacylglyceryltransferase
MVARVPGPVSASPASVLQILDIRDGGWNLWAGLLVAVLWAAWSCRKPCTPGTWRAAVPAWVLSS